MIPVDAHRERILAELRRPDPVEVDLADALDLVLAADVHTRWPVPGFDGSAMDGYAVRSQDARAGAVLRVVADVPAGSPLDPALGPGETARIMTGGAVPTAADAVVPLEDTDLGTRIGHEPPAEITVLEPPRPGAHVRPAGEDAAAGDPVVLAGTTLRPWHLSVVASAGHARVTVHRRPRVAVVCTGSELLRPGIEPGRGQVPESNTLLVSAFLRSVGADVVGVHTVPDDDQVLRDLLDATSADLVVLTGGASVGAFDVARTALEGSGTVRFEPVALQPGRPQGFGVLPDGLATVALPGNPVAVAVSLELFVGPAVRSLAGRDPEHPRRVTWTAGVAWRSPAGRTQAVPVRLVDGLVEPTATHHGRHVEALAGAEGLVVVPPEVTHVAAGDQVQGIDLRWSP